MRVNNFALEPEEVAQTRGKRLFTKNTAACEVVRRCIRCDACPVPEGYGEGLAHLWAKL